MARKCHLFPKPAVYCKALGSSSINSFTTLSIVPHGLRIRTISSNARKIPRHLLTHEPASYKTTVPLLISGYSNDSLESYTSLWTHTFGNNNALLDQRMIHMRCGHGLGSALKSDVENSWGDPGARNRVRNDSFIDLDAKFGGKRYAYIQRRRVQSSRMRLVLQGGGLLQWLEVSHIQA